MMKSYFLSFIFLILLVGVARAQYTANYNIEVKKASGETLRFPWAGGLNNPQFSEADLDNDGIKDLFVFDRTGNKWLTFRNSGIPGTVEYTYEPSLEASFPQMKHWALMADYNCDGIADLFTYSDGPTSDPQVGIQVYRGYFNGDNLIQFENADSVLEYETSGGDGDLNMFVSSVDIPAVHDVDQDGDLDVLTFQITGGFVILYNNTSQESGFGCDSLLFKKSEDCWGDFYESGITQSLDLDIDCPFLLPGGNEEERESRHAGSTVLSFDNDGDGDSEILLGDLSFSNLVYGVNCGSATDAAICQQDTFFPAYDEPADVVYFPAAFLADVNNDGLKDMIVSPNAEGGSENLLVAWLYENTGTATTADFNLSRKGFVVEDMIDVGEGSYPAWFDADQDGLLDMVVGNRGYFDLDHPNLYVGKLSYYRNTGDAANPSFQLSTDDYAGISSLNIKFIAPAFGDLDGDGDADMITGMEDGTLLYFKNTAATGSPASFVFFAANYGGIDVGTANVPQLFDVDKDGLLDIVAGEQSGNLNYYRNTGSATSATFEQESTFFGEVSVSQGFITGFSSPFLFDEGNGTQLYTGSESGTIYSYGNIDGNLNGAFTLLDSVVGGIDAGNRASVSGADVNDDGQVDLLVGNYRGGVTFYDSQPTVFSAPPQSTAGSIRVFPNPSNGFVSVRFLDANMKAESEVLNIFGEKVMSFGTVNGSFEADLSMLPTGVYFMAFSTMNSRTVQKLSIGR